MKVTATVTWEIENRDGEPFAGSAPSYAASALAAPAAHPVLALPSGTFHQLDVGGYNLLIDGTPVGHVFVDLLEIPGKIVESWGLLTDYFPLPGSINPENGKRRSKTITLTPNEDWSSREEFVRALNVLVGQGKTVRYVRAVCDPMLGQPPAS